MAEIRFKEDFTFEGTSTRRLCNENAGWSTTLMDPVIESNEFVFSIRIHTLTNLMIGVCRPYYPRGTFMGKEEEQCWVLYNSNGRKSQICTNDRDEGKNCWKDITEELEPFHAGEDLTFFVNKKKKTIFLKRTRGRKMLLYKDQDFPSELSIAISRRSDPVDIELVHYEEKFGDIDYEEDKWFDKKTVEFREVCKNYHNFQIPLKNRVLRFPKVFLMGTNIPNLKFSNEFLGLSTQSFPGLPKGWSDLCQLIVDYPSREKVMKEILKRKGFDYVDYYRFSRALGICVGMSQIREVFSEMSFKELYLTFKDAVPRLENKTIQGWFLAKEKKKDILEVKQTSFDSAFCMQLFVEMRKRMNEVDEEMIKLDPPFVKEIQDRLKSWDRRKNKMSYTMHKDFEHVVGRSKTSGVRYKDIFSRLQRTRDLHSNIIIRSSDKIDFPSHIEVLVCGYLDRFPESKMTDLIRREREFMEDEEEDEGEEEEEEDMSKKKKKKDKRIILEVDDMEGSLLKVFLDFAYQSYSSWLGNFPLHSIIRAMYHANEERDFRLLSVLCERLEKLTQNTGKREDVEDVVRKTGHLLHKNYELIPWVFPRLIRHSNRAVTKEEIEELVKKAHRKNMVTFRVQYLTDKMEGNSDDIYELKKLRKVIRKQKKEIEVLKKENSKVKEFLKMKFGDDIF